MVPEHRTGITIHELPWLHHSVQLWATWHHIDLRPLVTTFRNTILTTTNTNPKNPDN